MHLGPSGRGPLDPISFVLSPDRLCLFPRGYCIACIVDNCINVMGLDRVRLACVGVLSCGACPCKRGLSRHSHVKYSLVKLEKNEQSGGSLCRWIVCFLTRVHSPSEQRHWRERGGGIHRIDGVEEGRWERRHGTER